MILKRGGFGRPAIFMRQQVGLISRLMPDPGLSTGLCVGVVPQRGGVCGSGSVPCRPSVLRSGTADRTGCCCPGSSSFPAQMRPEGTTLVLAGSLPLADWNPLEVAGPVRRQGRGVRKQACIRSGVLAWDARPVFLTGPSGSPRSAFLPCPGSAPNDLCDGLIWPKDVFASTAWAQQRRHNFLPLSVRGTVIPRGTRKFLLCCQAPVKTGVRPQSPPASRSPSRPQWSGPETEQTEI